MQLVGVASIRAVFDVWKSSFSNQSFKEMDEETSEFQQQDKTSWFKAYELAKTN